MALAEAAQMASIARPHACRRFDLQWQEPPSLFQYEVHFLSPGEPPVIQAAAWRSVAPDEEVGGHQRLEVEAAGHDLARGGGRRS
jgi:hypothetical protein